MKKGDLKGPLFLFHIIKIEFILLSATSTVPTYWFKLFHDIDLTPVTVKTATFKIKLHYVQFEVSTKFSHKKLHLQLLVVTNNWGAVHLHLL